MSPESRGRNALFGAVPVAGRSGARGKEALFSAPPRRSGTVVIECDRCEAQTPVPVVELLPRLVPSVWIPGRSFSRFLRCPSCGSWAWCRVRWRTLTGAR